jgi:hypothetical protein
VDRKECFSLDQGWKITKAKVKSRLVRQGNINLIKKGQVILRIIMGRSLEDRDRLRRAKNRILVNLKFYSDRTKSKIPSYDSKILKLY